MKTHVETAALVVGLIFLSLIAGALAFSVGEQNSLIAGQPGSAAHHGG